MSSHIIFENIPITNIIDEITIKQTKDYNTSPYIGGTGSNTNFVSELGRILTFKSICPYYEEWAEDGSIKPEAPVNTFKKLADEYKNKPGVLTSPSHLDLKGNYLITGFDVVEDTGNNFTISWEFTEVLPFNTTRPSFQVWGSAAQSAPSKKQQRNAKTSGSKVNKSSNTLLKSCGTLTPSNKVRKCVKYLQKFMQSLGYYKNYKLDGIYAQYTKQELKKLQKAKKLKQTGNWDKATITYFKKKYKIN